MAFELAATSATSTAAGISRTAAAGPTNEEFLQEWNWCWITQGNIQFDCGLFERKSDLATNWVIWLQLDCDGDFHSERRQNVFLFE